MLTPFKVICAITLGRVSPSHLWKVEGLMPRGTLEEQKALSL